MDTQLINDVFEQNDWKLYRHCYNQRIYVNSDDVFELFYLTKKNDKIDVSFPLNNSNYNYKTSFSCNESYNLLEYIDNVLKSR